MDLSIIQALKETTESIRDWVESKLTGKAAADHKHDDKYDNKGAASSAVSNHNVSTSTHNDIRDLISGLTNRLNALADSDDTTLDQLSEIVAYIKSNKELIDAVTTSKVNVSDIINNLETNVTNKPLSAAQGVAIKGLINDVRDIVDTIDYAISTHEINTKIHITPTERTEWNGAYTHSQAAHARTDATKVSDSSINGNILINDTETTVYSHPNSGATAGTYRSVTVDAQGHVTKGDNPILAIEEGGTGATDLLSVANTLGFASFYQATKIPNGTDLNNILDIGNYKCTLIADANSFLNCPVKNEGFRMEVSYCAPGLSDYIAQDIYEVGGGTRHHRHTKDGGKTWQEWTTTYDSNSTIPIENGGTGVTTAKDARTAMNFIGVNPLTKQCPDASIQCNDLVNQLKSEELTVEKKTELQSALETLRAATDIVDNWIAVGTGHAYIGATDQAMMPNFPTTVACYIQSYVYNDTIYQTLYPLTNSGTIYHRGGSKTKKWYGDGTWQAEASHKWVEELVEDKASTLYSLEDAIAITSASDLNNYKTFGNYYASGAVASTLKNCPITVGFILQIERNSGLSNDTYFKQRIIPNDAPFEYWRSCTNKTFSPWYTTAVGGVTPSKVYNSDKTSAIFVNNPKYVDQMIAVAKSYYIKDAQHLLIDTVTPANPTGNYFFNYHQWYTCLNDDFGSSVKTFFWPERNKDETIQGKYSSSVNTLNFMDCSAYIGLVLRGIPYEKSPYVLSSTERKGWDRDKVEANIEDYHWATNPFDWYMHKEEHNPAWDNQDIYDKQYDATGKEIIQYTINADKKYDYYNNKMRPRGAANLCKLLVSQGCTVDYNEDFSNVEPGDIILYSSSGDSSNVYENITHIALCGSKELTTSAEQNGDFKGYTYKHCIYESTYADKYNVGKQEDPNNPNTVTYSDIPTFIRYTPVFNDNRTRVVDVISDHYLEIDTRKIVAIVRPNLTNVYNKDTRFAMNFIGKNPLSSNITNATSDHDIPKNWDSFGTGYAYISTTDKSLINRYPDTSGYAAYLHNYVYDNMVYQTLHPLTANGTIYHRGGSGNTWYGDGAWQTEATQKWVEDKINELKNWVLEQLGK